MLTANLFQESDKGNQRWMVSGYWSEGGINFTHVKTPHPRAETKMANKLPKTSYLNAIVN